LLFIGLAIFGALVFGVSRISKITIGEEIYSVPNFVSSVIISLFIVDVLGILWLNWFALPTIAHLRKFDLAAEKDFEKEQIIEEKNLEIEELKKDTKLMISGCPDLYPISLKNNDDKKYIGLEIINLNKDKKIEELGVFSHAIFTHGFMGNGEIGDGVHPGKDFIWVENLNKTIELRPEGKAKVALLFINNKDKVEIGDLSYKFGEELFFEMELIFKGRYEGENHFREHREIRAIYCSKTGNVLFSHNAVGFVDDISQQMKEAMIFTNKGSLYMYRPSEL
jgi:hypothetical protein